MRDVPTDLKPEVFVGLQLLQTSFSENTIDLSFENNVSLTIESSFSLGDSANTGAQRVTDITENRDNLKELIGRRVEFAALTDDGSLEMYFESGRSFVALNNPEYEAYTVRILGREIVV